MKISEEVYWALVTSIDDCDDDISEFELVDFDEEDFPEWCRIIRRLQGDICGSITLKFYVCPDCGKIHGSFEVVKE